MNLSQKLLQKRKDFSIEEEEDYFSHERKIYKTMA